MRTFVIAMVAGLLVFGLPPVSAPERGLQVPAALNFGFGSEAQADVTRREVRRKVRRAVRRVNRRHAYYRNLPRGCVRAAIRSAWYWRCGGVYYRELVEDGATVYIIVTP